MLRNVLLIGLFFVLVAGAQAQQPIQWISNTEQGLSQARQAELPLMFYVAGSSSRAEDDDMKSAQQATFRDPLVASVARERFITVRLALSTQTKEFLKSVGAPTNYGNYLVFTTPEQQSLGIIQPSGATQPEALARQMTAFFRQFRKQLFEKDMKAKLESPDTPAADQLKILMKIAKYTITEADDSVAKLLDKTDLDARVKKATYATLGKLATQRSIEALFKAAINDKPAALALAKAQNVAAEYLIPKLNSEDEKEFLAAYEAIIKICGLGQPKPKGFWNGKNQKLIDDELDRVEKGAKRTASAWREKYEAIW